jgi:two-component system NarL family sensor kinase
MTTLQDNQHLRSRVDEGAVAAIVVDEFGIVLEATSGASAMLGLEPAELHGHSLSEMAAVGWSWVVQNALLRLVSGSVDPFDLMLRGRSGRRTLVQMIPRPLMRSGGALQYLIVWLEQKNGNSPPPPTNESEAELRRLAYGLLKTHEVERGRVASELHDGVAPLVTMAKFMVEDALGRLARGAQSEATTLLLNTVARLRDALAEVRRISTDLRPSSLDDLGLLPTIEWYCRHFREAYPDVQVTCELKVEGNAVVDDLKLDIFRIVQEALTNVGRHSHAKEARVILQHIDDRLQLRIEDNGNGFDVAPLKRGEPSVMGVGLHSISKRVDATGGTLLLESSAWHGTVIGASWTVTPAAVPLAQAVD